MPLLSVVCQNLPEDAAIGIDPWCVSIDTAHRWERALEKKQQKLVSTSNNLVDQIWKDRPEAMVNPVNVQPLEFAGRTVSEKLQDLRRKLMQEKAHSIIVSALDEVIFLSILCMVSVVSLLFTLNLSYLYMLIYFLISLISC